jgi:hypothetical protein
MFGKAAACDPHITVDKYADNGIDHKLLDTSEYISILEKVGNEPLHAVGVGLFSAGNPKALVSDFIGGHEKGMREYYYYHDFTRASADNFPGPSPTTVPARTTEKVDLAIMLAGPSAEAFCRLGGDVWQGFLHITVAHGVPVNQILARRDAWTAGLQRMFPNPTQLTFYIEKRFLRFGRGGKSKAGNGMVGCRCINAIQAPVPVKADFNSALAELNDALKSVSLSDDSTDAASTASSHSSGGSDGNASVSAGAGGPEVKPCHFFKRGKCRSGSRCRFSHVY